MACTWKQLNPRGLEVVAVNAGELEEDIEAFLANFDTPLEFIFSHRQDE